MKVITNEAYGPVSSSLSSPPEDYDAEDVYEAV